MARIYYPGDPVPEPAADPTSAHARAMHEHEIVEEPVEPPAGPAAWADRADYPRWGFYAGLAGGVLILLGAFSASLFLTLMAFFEEADTALGGFPEVPLFLAAWGLLTGGAVLLAALRLKERPDANAGPGIVMAVGGLLSFLALGGFLVGGLLAIVGGVLAIAGARHVWSMRGPRTRGEPF